MRALSPRYIHEEFSLPFAKGAITLHPRERERLALKISPLLLNEGLCSRDFLVVGYGDPGLSAYKSRILALERAKYIRELARRIHLGNPTINIGNDSPKDDEFLGTVQITFISALKPLGC